MATMLGFSPPATQTQAQEIAQAQEEKLIRVEDDNNLVTFQNQKSTIVGSRTLVPSQRRDGRFRCSRSNN